MAVTRMGLERVKGARSTSESNDAGTKTCHALRPSHFFHDIESHVMEKDISEGEFAENDFFKYCIVYVIIFCFLLVWSDTPKENFVGIFSGSLPLVTEQCFLQKKSRWLACSAMDRTFSHSPTTLYNKPEKTGA